MDQPLVFGNFPFSVSPVALLAQQMMTSLHGMLNEDHEQPDEAAAQDDEERTRRAQLLRVAAHDLRGPLANIKSYVSLLKATRTPLEPRVQRSLDVISRNADRAIALVDDGLDAARLESGALAFDRTEQPLTPLIERALENSRKLSEALKVELLAEVPPELPTVDVDEFRMRRAVEALLLHFAGRSKPEQRVKLTVRVEDDQVRIRAESLDGVVPAADPFQGMDRMLLERQFEDPVRMFMAGVTAHAHGGSASPAQDNPAALELVLPI